MREERQKRVVCPSDEAKPADEVGRIVQRGGKRLKLYEMECKECGGKWRRWFAGKGEVEEYLRVRDVCFKGKHMVEGSLKGKVRVKRVRGKESGYVA